MIEWGWELPNPITEMFEVSALTRALNFMLFFVAALSYVISVVPLNLAIQRRFMPTLLVDVWSAGTCARFAVLSLPTALFALLVAVFVPNLEDLIGLVSTFAIPPGNLVFPAIALYAWHWRSGGGGGGKLKRPSRLALLACLVIGVAGSAITLSGTIWSMVAGSAVRELFTCRSKA